MAGDERRDDGGGELRLALNGLDGTRGGYLEPGPGIEAFTRALLDPALGRAGVQIEPKGPIPGVDSSDLASSGWGMIFPYGTDPETSEIYRALEPLRRLRREQATASKPGRYREYLGEEGCLPGEGRLAYLQRVGASPGLADPDEMPYYMLLVGSPRDISYPFQYGLDVQRAVGRLHLDSTEDYERYANTVVAAETGALKRPRHLGLLAPCHPGDPATELSSKGLAAELAAYLALRHGSWRLSAAIGATATRDRLRSWLGAEDAPALVFSAGHGVHFDADDQRQAEYEGALVCQEWPGDQNPLRRDHYLTAEDVDPAPGSAGQIAFHFACFGAGTPCRDSFAHRSAAPPRVLAHKPLVAPLARRRLAAGALAVIGHVDRAWGWSIRWRDKGQQIQPFESAFDALMQGAPVGHALEALNQRYGDLAVALSEELGQGRKRSPVEQRDLIALWTATHDARAYAVLGDPAVRVAVEEARR